MREFNAIIAVNNLGFIGKGDSMLWHSKEDFKHFKTLTLKPIDENRQNKLLVGNTTFKGMPPLKNRELIVVSSTMGISLDDALNLYPDWCIGGKSIYEQTCHLWTKLYISRINDNSIGDVTFPNLKYLNPNCEILLYNFLID